MKLHVKDGRGVWNSGYSRQAVNFEGLRWKKLTPTDIDGIVEFWDKGYVIIETKYKDTELKRGQQLALERLCDDLERAGKPTILFVTEHSTPRDKTVRLASSTVRYYRYKGKNRAPKLDDRDGEPYWLDEAIQDWIEEILLT